METVSEIKAERNKIRQMTAVGLMTAVICILGPVVIPLPFSPVPISFTNLALYLSLYVLGTRRALVSYLVYLLIGIVGLPVFSGFAGGFGKVVGPTGGYLVGFLFMILLSGFFVDRFVSKRWLQALGLVLGTVVSYVFGTLWLCFLAHLDFAGGLAAGVIPYIPGDILKIAAVLAVGPVLGKRVRRVV